MRQSTKDKLFGHYLYVAGLDPEDTIRRSQHASYGIFTELLFEETDSGRFSLIRVHEKERFAIVNEFNREEDGFEVYVKSPGNDLRSTQKAFGLPV